MPRHVPLALVALLFAAPSLYGQEKEKAGPLGVRLARDAKTATVHEVIKGSAAEKLGIKQGDVILTLYGTETPTSQDLVKVLRSTQRFAGDPVELTLQRGEETLELSGKLQGRPTVVGQKAPAWAPARWGNVPAGQEPPSLKSLEGKVVVLFCYQSW